MDKMNKTDTGNDVSDIRESHASDATQMYTTSKPKLRLTIDYVL